LLRLKCSGTFLLAEYELIEEDDNECDEQEGAAFALPALNKDENRVSKCGQ
jgi:hypothetical protein